MSGTGVNYQDLLPIPEKTNAVDDPNQYEKAHALDDGATASHALATQSTTLDEYGEGVAQQDHGQEVKNLGWNEPKQVIPSPLVGGMDNEELWLLVRRFNKVSGSRSHAWRCSNARSANVSRQGDDRAGPGQPRYERCRRGRILSR